MTERPPHAARLKMTKRLFKGTSGTVQKLARQAHKEMRLQERAQWWHRRQQTQLLNQEISQQQANKRANE